MTQAARAATAEPGTNPEQNALAADSASAPDARMWHAPETGTPVNGTSAHEPETGTPNASLTLGPEDDAGLQRLAVAVLESAVGDVLAPKRPSARAIRKRREAARLEALGWLLGDSPELRLWCDRAGLDPEAIASRLRARLPQRLVGRARLAREGGES